MSSPTVAQSIGSKKLEPNLESNVDTTLRYRPDGTDFVISNGTEFFNRALYGGNTAFRVEAGDKPEFLLYLPGRGGNLRLGLQNTREKSLSSKWLHTAQSITARYRPGGMIYEITDPLLSSVGLLKIESYALATSPGLILRIDGQNIPEGIELLWAYGGVSGQRGARDGDIGTERVPISEYFQLKPEFCKDNKIEPFLGGFKLTSKPATIIGRTGNESDPKPEISDASTWKNPGELLASIGQSSANPVVIGRLKLNSDEPRYLTVRRLLNDAEETEVPDLKKLFEDTASHFKKLRERVTIDTPDPFINAAAGAMNIAGDAVWDEDQNAIMHGAIAWRVKLLGWRGPYVLDALGWHDRARTNIEYWLGRQNISPIPDTIPPADENANLARSEAALHSNGDMSNSHYDMNLVFIDALFRHLLWTGDEAFAAKAWPAIERHLAWEQRMFRRTYGPDKLPLYEAYCCIWASDDLYYNGGGATHSSAYNYYHNKMAARIARMIGKDPTPYLHEAELILSGMRKYLWLNDLGYYAEYRDLLGNQLAHPSAALWTIYHTTDSQAVSPMESWQLTRYVDQMAHIPVRGKDVPDNPGDKQYAILPTTNWMPYSWSINNVCMNENAHTALSYWQAGRSREAYMLLKSSLLACMYMGIAPGNVGTMTYLDVYRRESQRDFGDGSGTLSRAMVEGLFGVHPDALDGQLHIKPGFPADWDHASFRHPDLEYSWKRSDESDSFTVESKFKKPMSLRLTWPATYDEVTEVTVNGKPAKWESDQEAIGQPRIVITSPVNTKWDIKIRWNGKAITQSPATMRVDTGEVIKVTLPAAVSMQVNSKLIDPQNMLKGKSTQTGTFTIFAPVKQGSLQWIMPLDAVVTAPSLPLKPVVDWSKPATVVSAFETVDLTRYLKNKVTDIFKQEYRSPRSPHVSLSIPKQGIGAWAGHVNATANIDDSGLRQLAAKSRGKIVMPNGVTFSTPDSADAHNIAFTSQWDNFPKEITIPLTGKSKHLYLLMAGSTNFMQSRFDNGEIIVTYTDGSDAKLSLNNPVNWWPIEQDYFIDDFQFRRTEAIPPRLNLKTGELRILDPKTFKGKGKTVDGGAANILELPLNPDKELKSLLVRTIANDVVIGLMSATLER